MSSNSYEARDIGVISDTHGLLREEARDRLAGCGLIIHAGDVGSLQVLGDLSSIAEVAAVRGNVDGGALADLLPATCELMVSGLKVFVIHQLDLMGFDPASRGIDVVVCGHTHRPASAWKGVSSTSTRAAPDPGASASR